MVVVVVVVVKSPIKTAKVDALGLNAYAAERPSRRTDRDTERETTEQTNRRTRRRRTQRRRPDDVSGVDRLKTHTCSAAATKLFDFNDISFSQSLSPPQNSGHCNSFHCLGHSKNVNDDDGDDPTPINSKQSL